MSDSTKQKNKVSLVDAGKRAFFLGKGGDSCENLPRNVPEHALPITAVALGILALAAATCILLFELGVITCTLPAFFAANFVPIAIAIVLTPALLSVAFAGGAVYYSHGRMDDHLNPQASQQSAGQTTGQQQQPAQGQQPAQNRQAAANQNNPAGNQNTGNKGQQQGNSQQPPAQGQGNNQQQNPNVNPSTRVDAVTGALVGQGGQTMGFTQVIT